MATEFFPQNYIATQIAASHFKKEQFDTAQKVILKALRKSPLKPELHMNLGLAQMGLGQIIKALGSFRMTEELTQDPQLKFLARFNQAFVLTLNKQINEALEMYQKALELEPNSNEVKINIELLMQQKGGKGGEGEDENQDKDSEGKDGKNNKEPKSFKTNEQYKPKFDSKNLSEGDVKKILDEIKRQEQQIHNNEVRKNQKQKDSPNDKDW